MAAKRSILVAVEDRAHVTSLLQAKIITSTTTTTTTFTITTTTTTTTTILYNSSPEPRTSLTSSTYSHHLPVYSKPSRKSSPHAPRPTPHHPTHSLHGDQ
ncbi:hypothetical protein E2C01_031986 [Portunus trituberculatus]|uniref:Uncharacterized protein n=1 Tax=Portunus trituberculatus TaxID=210409 RepID=A0A5B7EZN6_PORTR|nr:hypothetical protein [Portunus trituberculatus]